MSYLVLEGISKSYRNVAAVTDLSLSIEQGECLALLGPSGCGKTTLLRLIAGLETPDQGRVWLAGRDITRLPPEARSTGLVFQNYALFPHLSVAENVAFGLKARGKDPQFIATKVASALALVQLEGLRDRQIHQLSGGQQQRVAIARALAIEPTVLLLDEPLSNLDVALREQTGQQLRALIEKLRITTIFVTHDQQDAFALTDRVALINQGRLQQLGQPAELYFAPVNLFVAGFIGRSNFLNGTLVGRANGLLEYEVGDGWRVLAQSKREEQQAVLQIRPEAIRFVAEGVTGSLKAQIIGKRFAGATIHYRLAAAGVELEVETLTGLQGQDYTDQCRIEIPPEAITIFPKP
ncbi:MAG: ABC transporter ATP-binding protein [Acidobacteriota bacterium]